MVFLKQAFFFIALFVVISVNISWGPKVMALRDLPIDVAEMKGKLLLPFGNGITCSRRCNSDSDCNDGIFCKTCSRKGYVLPPNYKECSMF
ncbi:hypothetical protein FXO38_25802 [Capsicum annuum]|nr:hypothetical protein FXO38_25802 [Capsicum annuum]